MQARMFRTFSAPLAVTKKRTPRGLNVMPLGVRKRGSPTIIIVVRVPQDGTQAYFYVHCPAAHGASEATLLMNFCPAFF
jgi:hypothetical protein